MARVDNCCCCFSLKTGTLIIATLGWIGTLVKLFGFIGAATSTSYKEKEENDYSRLDDDSSDISADTLGYRIGYAVVALICCVLLVVGIFKKSSGYFIPYLIISCLECILFTIGSLVLFVFIFLAPSGAQWLVGVLFLFLTLFTALAWYFWTVVFSYYHVVKAEGAGIPSGGGNIYYSPTSNNPYTEKNRTQIA